MSNLTPFQTAGPFFAIGLRAALAPMTRADGGPSITINGRLIDGAGEGISDGVLEFWHPMFVAIGRAPSTADGSFTLTATKPSSLPGPRGTTQAPHFAVRVIGRGIVTQYLTRVYFADEPATASDPILALVPPERRDTLIAKAVGLSAYRFDVVVQGVGETVFFDA